MRSEAKYIIVNEHSYEAGPTYINNCLQLARDKYKKEKANAIYAIEKGDVVTMINDSVHQSLTKLYEASKRYKDLGFKVYLVSR